ncbi:hypothetical protein [Carbonactinospora thermoautotrophica]|nr:hypothetical protein [Carbonactinospora thermoautotrophica]
MSLVQPAPSFPQQPQSSSPFPVDGGGMPQRGGTRIQQGSAVQDDAARPTKRRPVIGLPGPRHDQHVLTPDEVLAFSFPVNDDGVVIGIGQDGHPAVLGLFRQTALNIAYVGSLYLAQIIALRAAATGARVVAETARPQAWAALAQPPNTAQPIVSLAQPGAMMPQKASVHSPLLVIRDCGALPSPSALGAKPWQTVFTLLPYLRPESAGLLVDADVVGTQRLSPQEVEIITSAVELPPEDRIALPQLPDDVTLWLARGARQYAQLNPTQIEVGMLGQPRRFDQ